MALTLVHLYKNVLNPEKRTPYGASECLFFSKCTHLTEHLNRWFETIMNQEKVLAVAGKVSLLEQPEHDPSITEQVSDAIEPADAEAETKPPQDAVTSPHEPVNDAVSHQYVDGGISDPRRVDASPLSEADTSEPFEEPASETSETVNKPGNENESAVSEPSDLASTHPSSVPDEESSGASAPEGSDQGSPSESLSLQPFENSQKVECLLINLTPLISNLFVCRKPSK